MKSMCIILIESWDKMDINELKRELIKEKEKIKDLWRAL